MPTSWPKPVEIFEHYLRSVEAFSHLKATLLNSPEKVSADSRFRTKTPEEIDDAFRQMSVELDIQINLLLIASSEASLRIDFQDRVSRGGKDSVSRRFRDLEQRRKARAKKGVRLEDILKVWADESPGQATGNVAGPIGRLLLYRHWIAHGRYWVENRSGLNDPDPYDVWNMIRRFFNSLPGFDSLPVQ